MEAALSSRSGLEASVSATVEDSVAVAPASFNFSNASMSAVDAFAAADACPTT